MTRLFSNHVMYSDDDGATWQMFTVPPQGALMFSKSFWKDLVERAVKTAAQAEVLALTAAGPANLFTMDWKVALGAAAGGALLSAATSLASIAVGEKGTASAV